MNENFYLVTSIISGIISLISIANYYTLTRINLISDIEAKTKIKSGEIKVIIDVRTLMEYNLGHYPNALHVPYNKINKNSINQINKNDGILVYCKTGRRARKAGEKLKKLGFKNVFYIASTYKTILDI